jgi:hypothetical protein
MMSDGRLVEDLYEKLRCPKCGKTGMANTKRFAPFIPSSRYCSMGEAQFGAVAFSRTGDPATGDFRDATVLRKFGDVPDDLSAL